MKIKLKFPHLQVSDICRGLGHVLLEFHHSVLASGCSGVVEFLSCYTLYLLISSPKDKPSLEVKYITRPTNTSTKKCRKRINACHYYFLSHLRVFSVQYFVKLPLFRNSYPGSHGTHPSPVPTTVRAIALIARKQMSRIMFPSLAFPCVELVSILQLTSIARRKHAARRFLRSVCMLMLLFQA